MNLLLKIAAWTVIPLGLIVLQDAGTGAICLFIVMVMVFMSGVNWKLITIIGGSRACAFLVIEFPMWRIQSALRIIKLTGLHRGCLTPVRQRLRQRAIKAGRWIVVMAIGSGGITGNGVHNLKVYVPEGQTDFIFAILGESFGF